MAYLYTIEEMERIFRKPIIRPRFRFSMLNPDETVSYMIPNSDVNFESTNYSEQYQNGVRRTMTLCLINTDGKYTPHIYGIWAGGKISFEAGIERADGSILWFPAGIYIINGIDLTREGAEQLVNISLGDKFSRFESAMGKLEGTYEIPQGSKVKNVIKEILMFDGGNGYPLDTKDFIYDAKFEKIVTPYTISKEAGSTLGEILTDLATILNAEMFYDEEGYLVFIPIDDTVDDLKKPILWIYKDTELEYGSQSMNFNFDETINTVHVIGSNSNDDIFAAMAENKNPSSPICVQRIGRRISLVEDSNIYTTQLAQERADYEIRMASIYGTSITVQSAYLPFLKVNNLVQIEDKFYGWERETFIIQSVSFDLNSGQMSVGLANMSNLPTFTRSTRGG